MPAPTPLHRLLRALVVLAATAVLVAQVAPAAAATAGGSAASYRPTVVQDPVLQRAEVVRWDPCTVIAWAKAGTTSHLGAREVAHGGWRATTSPAGHDRTSSGHVVVAGAPLAAGSGAGVTRGRVLLHELGHAVGLDHVQDPARAVHHRVSVRSPRAVYPAGDLSGLRRVGSAAGGIA